MLDWLDITASGNDYNIVVPTATSTLHGLQSVAERTVEHIYNNYPAPYTLYVSGGIDSQAMLWAWHLSGRPVNAVSYVYNNGMNHHDLHTAMPEFAQSMSVQIEYRNIDLLWFYQVHYPKYHQTYRCGSPHVCAYMYLADQQKTGTVIFSGSNTNFYTKNEWGLYHYGKLSGKSIVPFFLSETAEMHHYTRSIKDINMDRLARYHAVGFPVKDQGAGHGGFSGFEKIKDVYDLAFNNRVTPQMRFQKTSAQHSGRTYDVLLRNHLEAKYNDKYQVDYMDTH